MCCAGEGSLAHHNHKQAAGDDGQQGQRAAARKRRLGRQNTNQILQDN